MSQTSPRPVHLLVQTMPAEGSKYVEKPTKALGASPKEKPMTDSAYAQELLQEAFPIRAGRNVKAAIGEAFEALKSWERELGDEILADRERQWTERRVRSMWGGKEARRIDHYEIEDLKAVARKEASREFQRSRDRQQRLAALLADPAAYRGRELADLVRERVGGMDRA